MNGLLLPSGSQAPIRGDAGGSSAPHFTPTSSIKPEAKIGFEVHQSLSPTSSTRASNTSRRSPVRAASAAAASLAFIPQSTRSTAGLRKPIHQCSEFELEQMLDRNERILATLQHSQTPTRIRLARETETLRDAIRSVRAVREMDSGISAVQLGDPSAQDELQLALDSLSVSSKEHSQLYGISPPSESFGWTRDTLAVKKRLAQNSAAFQPGRKVQTMSYEQSLSIQTAALVAEMERERKAEEHRLKAVATARERSSLGVPSGAAHKLGRKSISSCSGSMRRSSAPLSSSPPKESRTGRILAVPSQSERIPEPHEEAQLEGGDSDQDYAADLYAEERFDDHDNEDDDDFDNGQVELE